MAGRGCRALPGAVVEQLKRRRLIGSPRHGQILSALMLPAYQLGTPPGHSIDDHRSRS